MIGTPAIHIITVVLIAYGHVKMTFNNVAQFIFKGPWLQPFLKINCNHSCFGTVIDSVVGHDDNPEIYINIITEGCPFGD